MFDDTASSASEHALALDYASCAPPLEERLLASVKARPGLKRSQKVAAVAEVRATREREGHLHGAGDEWCFALLKRTCERMEAEARATAPKRKRQKARPCGCRAACSHVTVSDRDPARTAGKQERGAEASAKLAGRVAEIESTKQLEREAQRRYRPTQDDDAALAARQALEAEAFNPGVHLAGYRAELLGADVDAGIWSAVVDKRSAWDAVYASWRAVDDQQRKAAKARMQLTPDAVHGHIAELSRETGVAESTLRSREAAGLAALQEQFDARGVEVNLAELLEAPKRKPAAPPPPESDEAREERAREAEIKAKAAAALENLTPEEREARDRFLKDNAERTASYSKIARQAMRAPSETTNPSAPSMEETDALGRGARINRRKNNSMLEPEDFNVNQWSKAND